MRFLVIGAGALGGYFGARLLELGRDVSFLLRERRARQIGDTGLVVRSPFGDARFADPSVVTRAQLHDAMVAPYDVILVGCKAYDLDDTMDAFAPAVGPKTMIVPILNGIAHIRMLQARFGTRTVLGGYCLISAAVDESGVIHHLNRTHTIAFGELDEQPSTRTRALRDAFAGARCEAVASPHIVAEMWQKWLQIATAAGMTCLMRAAIGDIIHAGGAPFAMALLDECAAIATTNGHPPSPEALARIRDAVSDPASTVTASMLKDIERGARIEGEHLIGDLLARRTPRGDAASLGLLDLVYLHLRSYSERQRITA